MRHDFLDRYSRLDSPVHRISSEIKLAVALASIVSTVAIPINTVWFFYGVFGFLFITIVLSKLPLKFVFGRLLLVEPFAAGVALTALLQHNGFDIFLSILVKSTLCLLIMILTSNTTPFSEILTTLKKIRVPSLLITVLALSYRYIFVLIDEGERLQRARSSRTFSSQARKNWLPIASLIGQLFVRSTERAEKIFAAMTSRGWK